jgi:hypothetical protein
MHAYCGLVDFNFTENLRLSLSYIFFLSDESWFSFLKQSDWDILIMDAILDVSTKDGKRQTIRVTVPKNNSAHPPADCKACKSQPTHAPAPTPHSPQEK